MCATSTGPPPYTCPMVKLGLVTWSVTPSARAAPRTNVVLPLPSSPATSTRSPGERRRASSAPTASVSCGAPVSCLTSRDSRCELAEQAELGGRHRLGGAAAGVVGFVVGLRLLVLLRPGGREERGQLLEVLAEGLEHRRA